MIIKGQTSSVDVAIDSMSNIETHNKILLIEDNPGDARLVELLLMESDLDNCQINNKTTLADGLAALRESDDYAAILLDLTLPDSRGFETLELLLEQFPDNNVIVLTGLDDKRLGINAVKAGAQDFLIKGAFDADQLSKSLRFSVERSQVLKRLEETQRVARIGNWEYNFELQQFIASNEIFRMFGINERKAIISKAELTDMNSPLRIFDSVHLEAANHKDLKRDIQFRTAAGENRFAFVQCTVSRNTSNQLVLSGIIQDITERKLAEKEMAKSQARYQEIFNRSKDAIYVCNNEGKIIDFNDATTGIFGYTSHELQGMYIHDNYKPTTRKVSFLEALQKNDAVQDYEIEIEQKSGEYKSCLITANKLEKEDFQGYTCIIRDITERKQTEELIKARDLAQQSAKMKEQFIASISHEMRTPMNAVLGMSNLVIKTDLNDEQFNYISSIKQSSEILLGIINDILEISTLENGKIEFEYKDFDLFMLLKNLFNVMQYKFKEKDIYFETDVEEGIGKYIKGDKLRLNQILYNLVGNGVKFTDFGHVKLRVKNLNENDSTIHLKFEVEDTGIGIPEDKLHSVFETFTRVRSKDRISEGTGLGLSISKNLVEQQGGKIQVESELGIGSTFSFDLVFEKGEKPKDSGEKRIEVSKIVLEREINLLLVEDHKMNQIVATKTLQKQWDNINITIAGNGQIAVDLVAKNDYDIILMDIQMPIMDGEEATKYIRTQLPPEKGRIPILAMTAHAHISKDEKYKELGMDDFVLKPFDPQQLFNKIAKYVQQQNNTDR
jgi:PAS domain S-box-containing protein